MATRASHARSLLAAAATCAIAYLACGPLAAADARYTDSGPEPLLAHVFEQIEGNHLDAAREQVEALIKAYPNFRLAHLIKGDLLLARGRPIQGYLSRVSRKEPTSLIRCGSPLQAARSATILILTSWALRLAVIRF